MHPDWQRFLQEHGARVEGGCVRFAAPEEESRAARDSDIVADLSHLALIRATGPEAETFLQSQFSNDLRQLGDASQLHAYCNAQGRMLALFRAFRRDDAILLQLPAALLEPTLKRLRMFVLRAKVTLESPADLVGIGVSGPRAEAALQAAGLPLPGAPAGALATAGLMVLRLPGPHPRFQIMGTADGVRELWRRLEGFMPVGAVAWSWLDIQAGLPSVLPETVEAFVPQMANLDLVGGISFNKGCYPGQEIVARMHYLGRLKQRMYRARFDGDCPPAGSAIYAPNLGEQAAGTVVDAQPGPAGGCDLLAVIQIASAEGGELHVGGPNGPSLTLEALPYALPAAASA